MTCYDVLAYFLMMPDSHEPRWKLLNRRTVLVELYFGSHASCSAFQCTMTGYSPDKTNLVSSVMPTWQVLVHCESKKLGHFFTAYNFRNIEQIFTKMGTNHVLFMLNIMP